MAKDDDAMQWKERVQSLSPPPPRQDHSPARERINIAFDEITEAKKRGVTWQQFADLMNADGLRMANGEPLTADLIRSLYHSERYARGQPKKRKSVARAKAKPAQAMPPAQPVTSPGPTPAPKASDDDDDYEPPKPEFGPITGYRTYKKE